MIDALKFNNKFGALLKNASNIRERYRMLKELLLEFFGSDGEFVSLACQLQREHGIEFRICGYFSVKDGKKLCHISSPEDECRHPPPQYLCPIRDWSRVPPKRK